MSWDTYNETIGAIREEYDMDLDDAREFYREIRDELDDTPTAYDVYAISEGEDYEPEDLEDWEAEGYESEGDYWYDQYDWDDRYFDDDWVDYGEEIEFTVEYEETT
jgi:hypothetical protein